MIRHLKLTTSLLAALILSGCVMNTAQQPAPVEPGQGSEGTAATLPPTSESSAPVPQPEPVPEPPKLRSIDWSSTVQPLLAQLQSTPNVSAGSVLLVSRVKNSTNGALQGDKATQVINQQLAEKGQFTLVGAQQLAQARQALGLSDNDSLNSRGKALGLARNLQAQYVLFSTARGNIKQGKLQMQLMTVNSGEIVWSGSAPLSYSTN